MKVLAFGVVLVALAQAMWECEDGSCCNAGCARQAGDEEYDCEVFNFTMVQVDTYYPDCSPLYDWENEPTDCDTDNADDCEALAQCAWNSHWANGADILDQPMEDGTTWGNFLCSRVLRDITPDGDTDWEAIMRVNHCGSGEWEQLENPENMPNLCCEADGEYFRCDA